MTKSLWVLISCSIESFSKLLIGAVLNLHELFIGDTSGILPLVIIIFLQRYIVEGYKQSGLKG